MFLSFNLSRIQKVLLLGVLQLVLAGCPSGQPMGFVPAQTVPTPVVSDPIVSPSQPVNPGAEIGISIRVDSVGGVALTYEWIPDEGKGKILAGEGTSAITYQVPTEPGTYSIRVKVTGADVTIERSTFINVHEAETPGQTLTDTEQPATTDILSPTIYLTLTLTSTPILLTTTPPPTYTPTSTITSQPTDTSIAPLLETSTLTPTMTSDLTATEAALETRIQKTVEARLTSSAPTSTPTATAINRLTPIPTDTSIPSTPTLPPSCDGSAALPPAPDSPPSGCVLIVEWWVPPDPTPCGIIITTDAPFIREGAKGTWWYEYPNRPESHLEEYLANYPHCEVQDLRN